MYKAKKHWKTYPRQRIESTSKNDLGRIGFTIADLFPGIGFAIADSIRGRIDIAVTPANPPLLGSSV